MENIPPPPPHLRGPPAVIPLRGHTNVNAPVIPSMYSDGENGQRNAEAIDRMYEISNAFFKSPGGGDTIINKIHFKTYESLLTQLFNYVGGHLSDVSDDEATKIDSVNSIMYTLNFLNKIYIKEYDEQNLMGQHINFGLGGGSNNNNNNTRRSNKKIKKNKKMRNKTPRRRHKIKNRSQSL